MDFLSKLKNISIDDKSRLVDNSGNKYGFISDKQLTMYNQSEESNTMIYAIERIDSIYSNDNGSVSVILNDGSMETHHRSIETEQIFDPSNILDYSRKDIDTVIRVIQREWINWKELLYFDELDNRIYINHKMVNGKDQFKPYMGDQFDLNIILRRLCTLQETRTDNNHTKVIHFHPTKEMVHDAIKTIGGLNRINSFYESIRKVKWDGIPRIEDFLINVGCHTNNIVDELLEQMYLRFVSKNMFLVALERCLNEEYKSIPFMLVIIGEQGQGKSEICKKIGMDWYRATMRSMEDEQKFCESVSGGIIVELVEGSQFRNTSVEVMKAFVEKDRLQYRKPYDKEVSIEPIRWMTITTTNNPKILTDTTGNRRFFPVFKDKECSGKQIWEYTKDEILQLWAEALKLYDDGERWDDRLYDESLTLIFEQMQSSVVDIEPPFLDLKDFLNENYSMIGDRISNDELREWFNGKNYYGQDVENKLQIFGKNYAMNWKFKSIGPTTINGSKNKRGYERVG